MAGVPLLTLIGDGTLRKTHPMGPNNFKGCNRGERVGRIDAQNRQSVGPGTKDRGEFVLGRIPTVPSPSPLPLTLPSDAPVRPPGEQGASSLPSVTDRCRCPGLPALVAVPVHRRWSQCCQ